MRIDPETDRHCRAAFEPAQPAAPRIREPRVRQPWARLLKAVLALAGDQAALVRHVEHPWESATFSGNRHSITLCFEGAKCAAAGEQFIATLPDASFDIPRWLVADTRIVSVQDQRLPSQRLVVEAELLVLAEG